jgi:hypothetical protein
MAMKQHTRQLHFGKLLRRHGTRVAESVPALVTIRSRVDSIELLRGSVVSCRCLVQLSAETVATAINLNFVTSLIVSSGKTKIPVRVTLCR